MWIQHPDKPRLYNSDSIIYIRENVAYFPQVLPTEAGDSITLTEAQLKQIGATKLVSDQKVLGQDGMPDASFFERLSNTGVFSTPKIVDGKINKSTYEGILVADEFRKSRKDFILSRKWYSLDIDKIGFKEDDQEMSWDALATYIENDVLPALFVLERKGIVYRGSKGKIGKFTLRSFFLMDHNKSRIFSPILAVEQSVFGEQNSQITTDWAKIPEPCRPYIQKWIDRDKSKFGNAFTSDHAHWILFGAKKALDWYAANNQRLTAYAKNTQFYKKQWETRCKTPEAFMRLIWIAGNDFFEQARPGFFPHPTNFDNRWERMERLLRESFDVEIGDTDALS